MADFTENFKNAPTENGRQFAAVASIFNLMNKKNTGPKSLSARDQSALMAQQHQHNIDFESHKAAVNHLVGQEAANSAHKRAMESSYQDRLFKSTEGMAERASKEKLARGQNSVAKAKIKADTTKDYQQRLFTSSESAANRQHDIDKLSYGQSMASNKNVRSFNPSTGAVTTTHPMQEGQQFNGVGEA